MQQGNDSSPQAAGEATDDELTLTPIPCLTDPLGEEGDRAEKPSRCGSRSLPRLLGSRGRGSQVKGLSPAGTGTSAGSIPRNGDNSPSSCQGSFQESCGRQRGCPESAAPSLWAGSIPACRAGSGWGTVGAEGPAPSPSGSTAGRKHSLGKGGFSAHLGFSAGQKHPHEKGISAHLGCCAAHDCGRTSGRSLAGP